MSRYWPGPVLEARDVSLNKRHRSLCPSGACVLRVLRVMAGKSGREGQGGGGGEEKEEEGIKIYNYNKGMT